MSCIFCAIVSGASPAHIVFEDDLVVAFLDHQPAATGHTLVVPRRHASDIWNLDPSDASAVMLAAVELSSRLRSVLGLDGLSLVQSNGVAAGQDVFHFHLHLIPRTTGDGLAPAWEGVRAPDADLAELAVVIRARSNGPHS